MPSPTVAAVLTRQIPLDLRARTHGGARPGAGRPRKKESERTAIAHRARPSHRKGDPVHVTFRVKGRPPSLRSQVLARIVKRALHAQRSKLEAEAKQHFQIVEFTIQDDHLHLIVEASDKRGLARGVAGIEIRIARGINKLLKRKGRFWKERYHRRDLRTPTEVRNALRYVLLNLHKHHRVIGERSFADPCSSAPAFDGFARMVWVFDDPLAWPRATPRTWLLDKGWRRHGPVDPADGPRGAVER